MINAYFDIEAFMAALDKTREQWGLTWQQIFRETGVNSNSLHLLRRGKQKDLKADTLAKLALWADLDVNPFMKYTYSSKELQQNGANTRNNTRDNA